MRTHIWEVWVLFRHHIKKSISKKINMGSDEGNLIWEEGDPSLHLHIFHHEDIMVVNF